MAQRFQFTLRTCSPTMCEFAEYQLRKSSTSVQKQLANPCSVLSCELHVAALCSTALQAKLVQLLVSFWAKAKCNSSKTSAKMAFIVRSWKGPSWELGVGRHSRAASPASAASKNQRRGWHGCSASSIHTQVQSLTMAPPRVSDQRLVIMSMWVALPVAVV